MAESLPRVVIVQKLSFAILALEFLLGSAWFLSKKNRSLLGSVLEQLVIARDAFLKEGE